MTRGRFILLITTICIIIGLGIYYFYNKYTTTDTTTQQPKTTTDFSIYERLFPLKTSTENTPSNPTNTTPTPERTKTSTKIHQISYRPVAGYGLFTKGVERLVSDITGKTTTEYVNTVRYADQETGIIYEQDDKYIENRISNTTIPNTYEALFSKDGTHIIYRFLDKDQQTILTYVSQLVNKTNTPADISGNFIYKNIKNIAISPDGLSYFFIKPKQVGVDVVSTNFTTKKETFMYSHPLSEWVIDVGNKALNITTKPSGYTMGYSYNIDNASGAYSKTLSGKGLTQSTSSDGLYKIYSTTENSKPNLFIKNTKTGDIYNTGLKTLPEKCTYVMTLYYCAVPNNAPAGTYPDNWYQGSVSFNDDLWVVDYTNKKQTFIESLNANSNSIDAIKLQLTNNAKTLYFIDKKTSLLWAYDL